MGGESVGCHRVGLITAGRLVRGCMMIDRTKIDGCVRAASRHVVNNERIRSIKPFDVGYCRARCGRSKTAQITRRIGGWHEVALYPASGTETRDDRSDRPIID
jgi:hypothetical protein